MFLRLQDISLGQLSPIRRYLLSALLGALGVCGFSPWQAMGYSEFAALTGSALSLLAWTGLFFLLTRTHASIRQSAFIGWCFGMGLFAVGVSWIFVSLHRFGGMAAPLALLATTLFCAVLAAYHALFAALFARLSPNRSPWSLALLFAALWGLTDCLRAWLFTGFPWLTLGYSQLPPSPLSGYFPVLGVFGVSLLTALCAALLLFWRRYGVMLLLIGAGGLALQAIPWTQRNDTGLNFALIQGNVPQNLKWDAARFDDTLRLYRRLTLQALADPLSPTLVVLPETAFPALLSEMPPAYLADLGAAATRQQATLLFGAITHQPDGYRNSALTLGLGAGQTYHKAHLVPFGEFIPWGFHWFLKLAHIPMSDFAEGSMGQTPIHLLGLTLAANICYEDCFGEEIIRALPEAQLLVNLSNTAWFGDSLAQPQHLQMARARALESGRPVLRATNTGMTAHVSAEGHVAQVLPAFAQGLLFGTVNGYSGLTPYARWGNLAFLLLAVGLLFIALRLPHRKPT